MQKITFATRPSWLARWQTGYIGDQLRLHWPELQVEEVVITTRGDRDLENPLPEIGGKGLFTSELEETLRSGQVDAAVHSLKDLPTEDSPDLAVGCIPTRAAAHDVLISPSGAGLDVLPAGAVVGTSSLRRQAQLLAHRPDLQTKPIRGNVETRIRKAVDGQYDAIVLAAAGVQRLGLDEHICEHLPMEIMLPAPGQGALGVQVRSGDERMAELFAPLIDGGTETTVTAERAFLSELGGGCSLPVGAYAQVSEEGIEMDVVVASPDGKNCLRLQDVGRDAGELGARMAGEALAKNAGDYIYV